MTWWQVAVLSWFSFGIGYSTKPLLRRLLERRALHEQRRFDAMTSAERFRAGWDCIRESFADDRWIKVSDRADHGAGTEIALPHHPEADHDEE